MKSVKLMVFSNILYFDKEILLTTVCTNIFNFSKFSLCFMSKTNADVMVPRSTFFTTYPKYYCNTALIDDAVRWLARLIFLIVILLILDTCMLREHIIDGALFGLLLFFGVDLCFFARSFSFFLWRFRADLLVKSLPHSGQSNSASRNAVFLSAMEHCIMAILSSFRFEAVVLAFVTFPQVSFCGSRLAFISIFPLLVEASLKECFVMPIVIFVFGRCRQPKLKLVKMVVKIFR